MHDSVFPSMITLRMFINTSRLVVPNCQDYKPLLCKCNCANLSYVTSMMFLAALH